MNATSPFDGTIVSYVILFAVAVLCLMPFVPPAGARATLGRAMRRFAHVPSEELEDAVESEGRQMYFSLAGIIAILVCGFTWRVVTFYSIAINHSLRSAGVLPWLSFIVSLLPAILPPFLYRWTTQWLLVRRLDRKFGQE